MMEYVTLNNGVKMPALGLGIFQMNEEDTIHSVLTAIHNGYRLIDTASAYGNEIQLGKAIKQSNINRKELFITSKLWVQDVGYENTLKAFNKTLERLQLDYLDLYLIHQPCGDYYGSYRAMEELYKQGKIKAIGVSNFYKDRLYDLVMNVEVKPAINQIETNVFFQRELDLQLHQEIGVQMQAWAPLAEGKNNLFVNEVLQRIAYKHHKSIAQVVLRWLVQRKIIVIAKSTKEERLQQNINIFDFVLDQDDMNKIKTLDKNTSAFFSHYDPIEIERMIDTKFDI